MGKFIPFLIIILLVSCKEPQTPQQMLLGNWVFAKTLNQPSYKWLLNNHSGYEFSANKVCNFKQGFFESKMLVDTAGNRNNFVDYLGTETRYELRKDSLKVFDLSEKKWDSFKIKKLTADTLIIGHKSSWSVYTKKEYEIDNNVPDFDEIIVSNSGCFGSCPMNDIRINRNGNVVFYGYFNNIKDGVFTSHITKKDFEYIENKFKIANYNKLSNHYYSSVTDNSTTSITFLKNGKILKTIDDYANNSPLEFVWAYTPLKYISQDLELVPEKHTGYFTFSFYASYNTKNTRLDLTGSEKFLLMNSLENSRESHKIFHETYSIEFYENKEEISITTDGRFYKFYFKDKTTKTVDMGYNFLTENKLSNTFQKR